MQSVSGLFCGCADRKMHKNKQELKNMKTCRKKKLKNSVKNKSRGYGEGSNMQY